MLAITMFLCEIGSGIDPIENHGDHRVTIMILVERGFNVSSMWLLILMLLLPPPVLTILFFLYSLFSFFFLPVISVTIATAKRTTTLYWHRGISFPNICLTVCVSLTVFIVFAIKRKSLSASLYVRATFTSLHFTSLEFETRNG